MSARYGLRSLLRDLHQRRVRSDVLSQTAVETGKRGFFPEFGFGEAARGFLGMNLDQADQLDPTFQTNLQERIKRVLPSSNPYVGTLGTDEAGDPYNFPDTKQERTGQYVDKTPLEAPWSSGGDQAVPVTTSTPVTPATETPTSTSDKVDNFLNKNDARTQWLQDTSRSPAARAKTHGKPTWSDEERWQIHLKDQQWRKNKGRNFTHGEFLS